MKVVPPEASQRLYTRQCRCFDPRPRQPCATHVDRRRAANLAAYEVENAELPASKLWNDTSDIGRWKPEVRPYTYNKHWILSERLPSA